MVAVMGDVFASVFNFHSPLSSKVKLSIQRGCKLRFLISRCWLFFFDFMVLTYTPVFVPIGVYLISFVVLWCASASGGVIRCSGITVCRVLWRLCFSA
jgi:hypothetical protein